MPTPDTEATAVLELGELNVRHVARELGLVRVRIDAFEHTMQHAVLPALSNIADDIGALKNRPIVVHVHVPAAAGAAAPVAIAAPAHTPFGWRSLLVSFVSATILVAGAFFLSLYWS